MSSQQCRAKLQSALQKFSSGDLRTSANDLLASLSYGLRTMRRLAGKAGLPFTGLPVAKDPISPVMMLHPIFQEK